MMKLNFAKFLPYLIVYQTLVASMQLLSQCERRLRAAFTASRLASAALETGMSMKSSSNENTICSIYLDRPQNLGFTLGDTKFSAHFIIVI